MANTTAFTGYPLWLANYVSGEPTRPLPGGWETFSFWQYSDSGRSPGIPRAAVDLDRFTCFSASFAALADGTRGDAAAATPSATSRAPRRVPGGVRATGWSIDPDTRGPGRDPRGVDGTHPADPHGRTTPAPTSDRVYPGFGGEPPLRRRPCRSAPRPPHQVCAVRHEPGAGTRQHRAGLPLGGREHRAVRLPRRDRPAAATRCGCGAGRSTPTPPAPITVHVQVDGLPAATPAVGARPDVAAA